MADLFGVRHGTFTMVREPNNGSRWSPAERTWGEYLEPTTLTGDGPLAGHKLQANVYLETYVPKDAQPILRHAEAVAGTVRQVAQGKAWLLGTFAGHCGTAYRNEESLACLKALLAQCGVRPAHPGRLLLRKRVLPGKEAWLFTNPTDGPVTEKISVGGWRNVESLLGEPLERDGDSVTLRVGSLDVAVVVVSAGA
jgi:hypothetical protein